MGRLPEIPTVPRDRSPCQTHGCSACCHDTEMLLTDADIVRLATVVGDEPFWRDEDGDRLLRTRDGPPAKGAPHADAKPCWFLADDGRCRVHEHRPEGCRLYPAMYDVDAEVAVLDADECPHTDDFRLPGFTRDAVGRLAHRLLRERDGRDAGAGPEEG